MKRTHFILCSLLSFTLFACPPPNQNNNEICNDAVDNDADGQIDCDDSDCSDAANCQLVEFCDNGIDDDGDGQVDCDDDGCLTAINCQAEVCDDNIDNNGNGQTDCDDAECAKDPVCLNTGDEICDNNDDDDGDGFIDCQDLDCSGFPGCGVEDDCGNGLDDDFDNLLDCDDPECLGSPLCDFGNACSDGIDNDGDFLVDAADPGCANNQDNDELDADQCSNGIDDDFDGRIDDVDPDCAGGIEANPNELPDLIMVTKDFQDDDVLFINFETVSGVGSNDVEFREGCFQGTGTRDILKWDSVIGNIGDADLVVGNPANHQPFWNTDNAFGNLQFSGWTRAFLFDRNGNLVRTGHKPSFCMINFENIFSSDSAPGSNCGNNQRISVGFADIYDQFLPCQFMDITGIVPGDYTLRVETNFKRELPEKSYDNNFIEVSVPIQ